MFLHKYKGFSEIRAGLKDLLEDCLLDSRSEDGLRKALMNLLILNPFFQSSMRLTIAFGKIYFSNKHLNTFRIYVLRMKKAVVQ